MTVTPETRRAFRLAYNALEAAGEPSDTPEYFTETAAALAGISAANPGNRMLKHLLGVVYEYIRETAQEK